MKPVHNASSLNEAAQQYFLRRDDASLQQVVTAAGGLIRFYASLYGKSCDRDDVVQTGQLGLLKALSHYDPSREATFVTYASHCIIGDIRHMVRKQGSYYRPGCIVELQAKVDKAIENYINQHDDLPSIHYIAQQLKVKPESIGEVMKAGVVSFEEIDAEKIHSAGYESFCLPIEDKITLYRALQKLTGVEQKVIHMLFYQNMSQQQVAEKMGLTQKKVSRLKQKSLQSMREDMEEDEVPSAPR